MITRSLEVSEVAAATAEDDARCGAGGGGGQFRTCARSDLPDRPGGQPARWWRILGEKGRPDREPSGQTQPLRLRDRQGSGRSSRAGRHRVFDSLRNSRRLEGTRSTAARLPSAPRELSLIERHRIDEREAFELLRSHSRRTGRKLIDIAEAVTTSHLLLVTQADGRAESATALSSPGPSSPALP